MSDFVDKYPKVTFVIISIYCFSLFAFPATLGEMGFQRAAGMSVAILFAVGLASIGVFFLKEYRNAS